MGSTYNKEWESQIGGHLMHFLLIELPEDAELQGYVHHPHVGTGRGWADPSGGSAQPTVFYTPGLGGTWFLQGHKVRVEISFDRNGVSESVVLHSGNDWEAVITAGGAENIDNFVVRGL